MYSFWSIKPYYCVVSTSEKNVVQSELKTMCTTTHKKARVAVIGTGVNGLCAVRRLSEAGTYDVTAFERNYDLGGLWRYTDQTDIDIFGQPIISPMYKNLQWV